MCVPHDFLSYLQGDLGYGLYGDIQGRSSAPASSYLQTYATYPGSRYTTYSRSYGGKYSVQPYKYNSHRYATSYRIRDVASGKVGKENGR